MEIVPEWERKTRGGLREESACWAVGSEGFKGWEFGGRISIE